MVNVQQVTDLTESLVFLPQIEVLLIGLALGAALGLALSVIARKLPARPLPIDLTVTEGRRP